MVNLSLAYQKLLLLTCASRCFQSLPMQRPLCIMRQVPVLQAIYTSQDGAEKFRIFGRF